MKTFKTHFKEEAAKIQLIGKNSVVSPDGWSIDREDLWNLFYRDGSKTLRIKKDPDGADTEIYLSECQFWLKPEGQPISDAEKRQIEQNLVNALPLLTIRKYRLL